MSRSISRLLATSAAAGLALFVTACGKPDSAGGAGTGQAASAGAAASIGSAAKPIALAELPATAKTVTLGVTGMTCDACVEHITETLAAMDGVLQETVSLEEKSATVAYDPAKVKVEDLAAAITKLKYTVALPELDAAKASATGAATTTISGFPDAPADAAAAPALPDVDTLKAAAVEKLEAAKTTAIEQGTAALDGAKTSAADKTTTALEGVPTMPEGLPKPAAPAMPAMPKLPATH